MPVPGWAVRQALGATIMVLGKKARGKIHGVDPKFAS
jgi:hypothetical protein